MNRTMGQEHHLSEQQTIDYGQDAPAFLKRYLLWGGLLTVGGGLLTRVVSPRGSRFQRVCFTLGWLVRLIGSGCLARGIVMIWSSRASKVQAARHLLDTLSLQGNETLLDLGCGRGLLLLEAARRLPQGQAIGLDLWSNDDQGANSRQATLQNAAIKGVADRVEVRDGDMRDLSFLPDGSVDVVVASKAIHNIPDQAGRRLAIREAIRVLPPGGRIAIMDIFLIDEFAESLRACGMQEVNVSTLPYLAYPPLRTVTAIKNQKHGEQA